MPTSFTSLVCTLGFTLVWTSSIVLFRLWHRWIRRVRHSSDVLALIVLVLNFPFNACAIYVAYVILFANLHGNQVVFSWCLYISILMSTIIVPITKSCVIALLMEVEPEPRHRRRLKILQTVTIAQTCFSFIINFFGCYRSYLFSYWSIVSPHTPIAIAPLGTTQPKCIVRRWILLESGIANEIIEVFILYFALSIVFRFKATVPQRIGLGLTFCLGLFTMSASVVSTILQYEAIRDQSTVTGLGSLHNYYYTIVWTAVENTTGILVANILPLRSACISAFAAISGSVQRMGFRSSEAASSMEKTSGSEDIAMQKDEFNGLEDISMQKDESMSIEYKDSHHAWAKSFDTSPMVAHTTTETVTASEENLENRIGVFDTGEPRSALGTYPP